MDPTSLVALIAGVPGIGPYLAYLPVLVALCAVLDAALPQPVEGSPWVGVRRVVSFVGINFGAAANLVRPGAIPAGVAARAAEVRSVAGAVEQTAGALATAAESAAESVVARTQGSGQGSGL